MINNNNNLYEEWRQAQHISTKTFKMKVLKGYEVSNRGRFRRKDNKKLIEGTPNNVGRVQVMVTKKRYQIHRIAASTFLLNDEPRVKKVVMHLDSNPLNNHVSNLKWGTQSENLSDLHRKQSLKASAGWQAMNEQSKKSVFVFDTEKMKGQCYNSNSEASESLDIDRTTIRKAIKTKNKIKKQYFITSNEEDSNEEAERAYKILSNFEGVA